MSDYNRDMGGALFPNRDKGDNPARPDYTGDITISGVKWRLAGWLKDGRNGKFLSLKASEDRPRDEGASSRSGNSGQVSGGSGANRPAREARGDVNDEIPF